MEYSSDRLVLMQRTQLSKLWTFELGFEHGQIRDRVQVRI